MSQDNTEKTDRSIPIVIEDELKSNFLDYAMSVIVSRALPDIRDGLKPVHRRVLYTMMDLGLQHGKPFKKCARIVGDCLGKWHPHGDTSVYDALVRMAQPWSLRYPLIKGQGNFGSIDGDSAAAMRYCITGESLILTDRGILPITNISNKQKAKINMKILSYNGKKNTASKFFNSGKHNIIELKTDLGYKILGSYNHPIMCWTFNDKPKIEWKLLENITKKDVVILNRNSSLFSKKDLDLTIYRPKKKQNTIQFSLPKKMNKDLAFLLGSLVAEGSFHQKKIIFNNLDKDYYNKVKNIIYEQFKGIQIYERKIAENCLELEIYHQHVVNFLKNIGLKEVKSDKKEIPFSVLQSTKKVVVEFLKGLFEGDGSVKHKVDKRHSGQSMELTYTSKSEKLIEQLKILLLNFGIVTTLPYKDKRNDCYKLIISGHESTRIFKNKINFFSNRKVSILKKIDSMNSGRMSKTDFIPYISEYIRKKYKSHKLKRNNFDRYNNLEKNIEELLNLVDEKDADLLKTLLKRKYLFSKVKEIKKLAKKEKVYSIKVDSSCHSFVANGFINHNTEARLEKISTEILTDIDKDTVDFRPNFDGSLNEPVILPSKTPTLLINGSSGIAVGMATNIPPHNLKEVCRAIIMTIENPEISILDLTKVIKGPDFPTGGLLCGDAGIKQAYSTGKGKVRLRARIEVEEKKGRTSLIIKEIPYMVNKSSLLENIVDLVKKKIVTDLAELRDESDREGMRVVLTLKKNSNPEIVMNQLFKHSRLESVYGVRFLALLNNVPKTLNLKSMIEHFIEHRVVIITRKTKYELKKAKQRAHIIEGLIIALNNIDKVIDRIKKSKNAEVAQTALIRTYKLSVEQAKAILDMKLQRLAALEQQKIKSEHAELLKTIAKLEGILADKNKILQIIVKEQEELIEKYGDERRTDIIEYEEDINIEDLIDEEDVVVTISHSGYIKRMQLSEYRQQMRGGKGVIGAEKKEEDFLEHLFIASTHSYLLIFTDKGKIYWLKVYRIPEVGRYSKGKAIVNLVGVENDEKISAVIPVRTFDDKSYLIFATKLGLVKKTRLRAYSRPRQGGIWAINLRENDDVVSVVKTNGEKQLIIATRHGMAVRFNETNVRSVSRHSVGVRGIRLKKKDDRVIGMVVADETKTLLTVTEHGYGKRTPIRDYRLINRGGSGVINIKTTERNGRVVTIKAVDDETGLMFISVQGQVIRTSSKFISVISRNTQGVRLMRMNKGDKVADAAKIIG